MVSPSFPYTPAGVQNVQGLGSDFVSAGNRAQIRHGAASSHSALPAGKRPIGLHPSDLELRSKVGPLTREEFLKSSEQDLHDAVSDASYHCRFLLILPSFTGSCS